MNSDSIEAHADRLTRSTLLAGCVCAILAGGSAQALELGDAVVRSSLGQRLNVAIPFKTWGNERLTADCVSLVRGDSSMPTLTAGRVTSATGNRLVIQSDERVLEPLLTLNVKVACRSTPFIVRSYDVILDPPGFSDTMAETSAADAAPSVSRPVTVERPASEITRRAPTVAEPVADNERYRVRVGDTLSGIAARIPDRTTSIWETAERIFRANPDAFIDGNMDLLRAGTLLVIPDLSAPVSAAQVIAPAAPPVEVQTVEVPPVEMLPVRRSQPSPAPQPSPQAVAAAPVETSSPDPLDRAEFETASPGARLDAARQSMPTSPFKDASPSGSEPQADTASPYISEAGPAPAMDTTGETAMESNGPSESTVSPLFAALFGAGIGLLLGLLMFRSAIRDSFRRAPESLAAPTTGETEEITIQQVGIATVEAEEIGDSEESTSDTNVQPQPGFVSAEDDSMIVSEIPAQESPDRIFEPMDFETDATGRRVITSRELEMARMSFAADEDEGDTVSFHASAETESADEIFDGEETIVETDTGVELTVETPKETDTSVELTVETPKEEDTFESPSVVTVADLQMLEEDYQQEFTATQRLAKELADAALAMGPDFSAEDATGADETNEHDGAALLETAEMLAADQHEVETDVVEDTGIDASRTTRLPSADAPFDDETDDEAGETAVVPLHNKRRA